MKIIVQNFNAELFKQGILKSYVKEQTKRLEKYAEQELNAMATSHEFMNQTYNLQDSFCWVLYFNGEKRSYGFYGSGKASETSKLHAWGAKGKQVEVNGRELAQQFIDSYQPTLNHGWELVWASTAPYGAYLESGSTPRGLIFRVISQRYDQISNTLRPLCKTTFEIHKPTI